MSDAFDIWMREVNLKIGKLSPKNIDLDERELVLWWEDEMTPTEAARKAIMQKEVSDGD